MIAKGRNRMTPIINGFGIRTMILAAAALGAGTLGAATISDNLSTISAGTRMVTGSSVVAGKFTTGSTSTTLTSVTLPLVNTSVGVANLFIFSETNSRPGSLVGTLTSPASFPTTLTNATFTSSTGIPLMANTSYYVVLQANSGTFGWSYTASSTGTGSAFQPVYSASTDNGVTWNTTTGEPQQMQITTADSNTGGGGCAVTLSSPGTTVTSQVFSGFVNVTSSCAYTVSTSAPWITVLSGTNGNGNGVVSYSVGVNNTSASRTGTITIGDKTFTINQTTGSTTCQFALSSNTLAVGQIGTTGSFTVNTTSGCAYTATTSDSFITITSGATGNNTGTVSFSVTPNQLAAVRTGTITVGGMTFTITQTGTSAGNTGNGLLFVPVTPCRVVDTRLGGSQLNTGETRIVPVVSSACGIPATAAAYAVNLTVVPSGPLGYVTLFPSGQSQPFVSTLNSDGRIKANAAIVPAGANGSISVFASNPTHVVVDITGYFTPNNGLAFFPVTPCRVSDTRSTAGNLGGPQLTAGQTRTIPVQSACGIPATAQAYSLNVTAVPTGTLSYLSLFPTGQTQPLVSTLNSFNGATTANAAIVPAGTNGSINVFATDATDVVVDINGYFAPPATGGLKFYTLAPCRVSDSRLATGAFGGPTLTAAQTRTYALPTSTCNVPTGAQAYSLNATVLPQSTLGYLTLFPAGVAQPTVSTLNADASVVANAAIVRAGTNGAISAYVTDLTELVLDINGYFAP